MQTLVQTEAPVALPPQALLDVSVIVVSYNSRPYLSDLFASLRLAEPAPREIILVDNASTDASLEYVEAHYPEVKTLRMPENLGFACANNQAAALAQGETLIFLNPDTRPAPGTLAALVAALQADPACGMVTAKVILTGNPDAINACGNTIHLTGIALCRGAGQPVETYTRPEVVNAVSGSAFAMPRRLFHRLGGFDPAYFMYMEDTDLSLKTRLAGYTCRYVPEALVYHDYRLRFGPLKTYYQERNRYAMLLKHYRLATLALLLPVLLLAEIIVWAFILLREPSRWRNKTAAYTWVWRNRRSLAQARARVQAHRLSTDRALILAHASRLDFLQVGRTPAARAAALVFNPLFALSKAFLFAFLWW
jgi:GT2 family glycosyltransferase